MVIIEEGIIEIIIITMVITIDLKVGTTTIMVKIEMVVTKITDKEDLIAAVITTTAIMDRPKEEAITITIEAATKIGVGQFTKKIK